MSFDRKAYMSEYNRSHRHDKLEWYHDNRESRLEYNHLHRSERNDIAKEYRRTPRGYVGAQYGSILQRTRSNQKKWKAYRGLPVLPRKEYIEFALSSPEFHRLYGQWVQSGYQTHLAPSVDRIDGNKGYVLGNMRFLSLSDNSSRPKTNRRWRKTKNDDRTCS